MNEEYLIKKWLKDELSEVEAKAFNALENAAFYKRIIDDAQRFSGYLNAKVPSFDSLEMKLTDSKTNTTNWTRVVSGFAAILIVGFALFTLINKDQISSFKTDLAQNETITLPDNSIVNLNELSELNYADSDWDENRTLNLSGEAFFDVEKGMRFDVNTDFGKVSVLGTEFNVLSRDSVFKVSCYEGLVQVIYDNGEVKLPAGTEFILSSGEGKKSNITVAEPYWLKNMSVFENAPIIDVVKELIKQYNVVVSYPSEMNLRFTGAFEHNNLENALESITKPLNLTYTVQNNKKVIIRNGQN
ncbi:FecR family protein [Winogradskyella tangerina]|uniref:FecR family protein n=1 Tax=Winogradskyella tangerina TaxID=2023240 RepID=UPI000DBE6C1F|nr:FecR family protein [Winogradskyella tangerina]